MTWKTWEFVPLRQPGYWALGLWKLTATVVFQVATVGVQKLFAPSGIIKTLKTQRYIPIRFLLCNKASEMASQPTSP